MSPSSRPTPWSSPPRNVQRIQRQLLLDVATPSTPIRLAVVTQLAEGPDRWVAQEAMRFGDACDQPVRLEVILPMCRRAYIERQGFDDASRTEFEALLEQAASVYEPRGVDPLTDEEAYEAAGHRLVRRCDVLISVWDGTASRGRGGTAETLVHAAWLGKPCIWIRPEHGSAVASDNISDAAPDRFYAVVCDGAQTHPLRPPDLDHDALSSLKDSYRGLDELNRTPNRSGFEDRLAERLQEDPAGEWIASSLVRASMLAGWYHRTFRTLACPSPRSRSLPQRWWGQASASGRARMRRFSKFSFLRPPQVVSQSFTSGLFIAVGSRIGSSPNSFGPRTTLHPPART